MKVLANLQERATGMRRESEFSRKPVFTDYKESINPGPVWTDRQDEYRLTLTVGAAFFADRAAYPYARKIAEQSLVDLLYKDVLTDLHGIMHVVSDGNQTDALRRISELLSSLRATS